MRWNAMAMVRAGEPACPPSTAATSRATRRPRRCTKSASITSGARRPTSIPATWCSCRATRSPGIYARAYLEGRLTEEQLQHFRQEVGGGGLSSYPHPVADAGLLAVPDGVDGPGPDDGDLPGALHALPGEPRPGASPRTARCGLPAATARWTSRSRWARSPCRCARSSTTSIFVINCNLQRLDGPVRGNGKIIQELEAAFLGAGWNVIKVLWGSRWDPLLARDTKGLLRRRDGGVRRRRVPELQGQGRRVHARALLRQVSGAARRWSPTCPTRRSGA